MDNIKTIFIDNNKFKTNPNYYAQLINQISPFDTLEFDDIEKQLQNDVYFCVLLVDNNVSSICRTCRVDNRKSIYINRPIVTADKYQGKGSATKCLIASEKYLQQLGCKRLISFVDSNNIASLRLHVKAGYEKVERDSIYKKSRYSWKSAIMFEKALTKQQMEEKLIIQK